MITDISPDYVLSRPERYSKQDVADAREAVKDRRNAREAQKNYPAPDELASLLIEARKCRSQKKLLVLKSKIEAITGVTYHI